MSIDIETSQRNLFYNLTLKPTNKTYMCIVVLSEKEKEQKRKKEEYRSHDDLENSDGQVEQSDGKAPFAHYH